MADILKYLIVDDDEIGRLAIEAQASKYPHLKMIASCPHPLQAAELINRFEPDILFVDIEMPDMSGLELVRLTANKKMLPVFITSHPEFAVTSYEADAFDYLLKPFSGERFAKCIYRLTDFLALRDKAFAFEKEQESEFIIIKQGYEKQRLQLEDILYLEAMKDYTRIVTTGKQYLVLATISSMLEKLPGDKFIRIHRSYVVNINKIKEVKDNKLYLSSGELPIGKLFKNALNEKF
jgi:DNA-binding LytR/AlgR family response regulator